jgi:hypothetical protein
MESGLAEATAIAQRREREYVTLRDSLKGLTDSFKSDHAALRDEMRKREERLRKEAEETGKKYRKLLEETKEAERAREKVRALKEEKANILEQLEEGWRKEIADLKAEVEESTRKDAANTKIVRWAKESFAWVINEYTQHFHTAIFRQSSLDYDDSCKQPAVPAKTRRHKVLLPKFQHRPTHSLSRPRTLCFRHLACIAHTTWTTHIIHTQSVHHNPSLRFAFIFFLSFTTITPYRHL